MRPTKGRLQLPTKTMFETSIYPNPTSGTVGIDMIMEPFNSSWRFELYNATNAIEDNSPVKFSSWALTNGLTKANQEHLDGIFPRIPNIYEFN